MIFAPPSVPVEWRAMPLGRLLPLVGKRFGRELEATPALAKLPILVRIEPGERPETILRAIAECVYADWKTGSDGVTRLVRDQSRWDAVVRADREALRQSWELILSRKRKRVAETPLPDWRRLADRAVTAMRQASPIDPSVFFGKLTSLVPEGPDGRLAAKITALFRTEDLLDLNRLGVVFSDAPTASQRPLPSGIAEAVREWQASTAAWHDAAQTAQLIERFAETKIAFDNPLVEANDAPLTLGRTIIRLAPSPLDDRDVIVSIRIYDGEGALCRTIPISLQRAADATIDPDDPDSVRKWQASMAAARMAAEKTPERSFSPTATAQTALFGPYGLIPEAALVPVVADTVTFDPFAGSDTERAVAFAAWKKRSIVEWFDDELPLAMGGPTFRVGRAAPWTTRLVDIPGKPLLVRPAAPSIAAERVADRGLLAKLVRASGTSEAPSLDIRAETAYAVADAAPQSLLRRLPAAVRRTLLQADGRDPYSDNLDGTWLALYGSLPRSLRSGGIIPLSQLTEKGRSLCYRKIYGVEARNPRPDNPTRSFGREQIGDEPTVRWPQAPPNGTLTIQRTTEEVVVTKYVERREGNTLHVGGGREMTAGEYADALQDNAVTSPADRALAASDPTRVRYGQRTLVRMELRFRGDIVLRGSLKSVELSSKEFVPLESLPRSFRDAVEAARKAGTGGGRHSTRTPLP